MWRWLCCCFFKSTDDEINAELLKEQERRNSYFDTWSCYPFSRENSINEE